MKRERAYRKLILLLTMIMVFNIVGCSKRKTEITKEQYTKFIDKILELDRKIESGKIEQDDEEYSEDIYGQFAVLLSLERKFGMDLNELSKAYEEDIKGINLKGKSFRNPDDFEKIRKSARDIDESVANYLERIKKLTEDNLKEVDALELPEDFKEIYLDTKKNISKILNKSSHEKRDAVKGLSDGLIELADIIEKMYEENDLTKVNEYEARVNELLEDMEGYMNQLYEAEEDYNEKREEILDDMQSRIKAL